MQTGFPPDAPWRIGQSSSGLLLGWCGVLLAVGAVALVGIKLRREIRRAARPADLWLWFGALWGVPLLGFGVLKTFDYYCLPSADRPFPFAYRFIAACFLVAWLIVCGGFLRTAIRLWLQKERSLVVGIAALCPMIFALVCWIVLMPRTSVARPAARRSQCRNNLKQIGSVIADYVGKHGAYPLPVVGDPAVSWRVDLCSSVDFHWKPIKYDRSRTWDHPNNEPAAKDTPEVLSCPSSPHTRDHKKRAFTHYVMVTGEGTIGPGDRPVSPHDITDGTSNTILAVEAVGLSIVWTEPRDFNVDRQPIGVNLSGTGRTDSPGMLSSYHAGGAHVVLADGSVRFVAESIDREVLKALTTIAGSDNVDDWLR